MTIQPLPPLEREDLGEGLILRAATTADAEPLAKFNESVHLGGNGGPDIVAGNWTRDLLSGNHPTSPLTDFAIVEDTKNGRIASSCLLMSQEWRYGGIRMQIGRPELVGTHPDYRGRGMIERQFAAIHRRSAERGHLYQAISGIPYYYARVGYQPTLVHRPQRFGSIEAINTGCAGGTVFPTRLITPDDLDFVTATMERAGQRSLIASYRDRELWEYEFFGRSRESDFVSEMQLIEGPDGIPLGLFTYLTELIYGQLMVTTIEVTDDARWAELIPTVLSEAVALYERLAGSGEGKREIAFSLVPDHPFYAVAGRAVPGIGDRFAWEIRIPDRPRFVRTIAPILEQRIAESPFARTTRDLEMTFFESGMRISFVDGRLVDVVAWRPEIVWYANLRIPPRVIDTLLMGSRTVAELEDAFPEFRIREPNDRALLETLFPSVPSRVWPIS